jgi:hypothetical protein
LTLDELRLEPTIYLLPEWETEEEALQHLAEVSNEIFEEQLNGWYRVPSVWPATGDLKTFLLWFDCSFHSMVVDVCDERERSLHKPVDTTGRTAFFWTVREFE